MKNLILLFMAIGMATITKAQQAPRTVSQDVHVSLNMQAILGFALEKKMPDNSLYLPVRYVTNRSPFANLNFSVFSNVPYDYTLIRKATSGRLEQVTCVIAEK
jgi:hypothetical protein